MSQSVEFKSSVMGFTLQQCEEQLRSFKKAINDSRDSEKAFLMEKLDFWEKEIEGIYEQMERSIKPHCEQLGCAGRGANQYYCLKCNLELCDVCKFHHLYNLDCPADTMLHGTRKENQC